MKVLVAGYIDKGLVSMRRLNKPRGRTIIIETLDKQYSSKY